MEPGPSRVRGGEVTLAVPPTHTAYCVPSAGVTQAHDNCAHGPAHTLVTHLCTPTIHIPPVLALLYHTRVLGTAGPRAHLLQACDPRPPTTTHSVSAVTHT